MEDVTVFAVACVLSALVGGGVVFAVLQLRGLVDVPRFRLLKKPEGEQ